MEFSYSRISSYRICPSKFYRHYILKEEIDQPFKIETLRGLALHEYAENKGLSLPEQSFDSFLPTFEKQYNIQFTQEDKTIFNKGIKRLDTFFNQFITPLLKQGYQLFTEQEFVLDFFGHKLITKIDVLLLKRGSAIIIDYKTGKTKNVMYYYNQMALYLYAVSKSYTIPPENIQTKMCFLLAPVKIDSLTNSFLKGVPLNNLSLLNYYLYTLETISEIENNPSTEPCLSRMCTYCEYKSNCDLAIITQVT